MKTAHSILRRPLVTEKGTMLREKGNHVIFSVARGANKIEIKKAVEKLFKVKVVSVTVSNMEGKKKRLGRFTGKKSDWKKAVVKLSPKDKITIFEGA